MSAFSALSLLIATASLFSLLNHRLLRLPATIGVTILVLVVSLGVMAASSLGLPVHGFAVEVVDRRNFREFVLNGVLAYMLFAGALKVAVDFNDLRRQRWAIGVLAVVTFSVILGLLGAAGPTGTVGGGIDFGTIAILLVREVLGGLVLGFAGGWLAFLMLRSVDDYQVEILLTLGLATGLYGLATALHTSGPLAVVVAGLLVGGMGRDVRQDRAAPRHLLGIGGRDVERRAVRVSRLSGAHPPLHLDGSPHGRRRRGLRAPGEILERRGHGRGAPAIPFPGIASRRPPHHSGNHVHRGRLVDRSARPDVPSPGPLGYRDPPARFMIDVLVMAPAVVLDLPFETTG